ncbi:MFS general substrate transporter [Mycena venus]|uniref:MFS general substrate transporter n=1 Tax=Mycena venus TaxID=2733690 RepID=A0A8H7D7L3_9AGAR|nr:MFS general substrate transporter [Mycena venus]
MSGHNSQFSADISASQLDEIELASRIPLPTSRTPSTFFISADPQTPLDPDPSNFVSSSLRGSVNESNLPPVDRGNGAWSFLAAAFIVEAVVWGFPNSYGVFLDAYLQDPRFTSQKNAPSLLPLIGTLSSGIIYCSGSVINPISARYPEHRRKSMWLGAILCCGTLLGASYATEIFQLILSQGILYAIGGSLLYLPCVSFMSEWFIARRGMANGILFAGNAAGGLLLPLVLPPLISKYGSSKTLRILAIAIAIFLFPLLPFIKGRLPQTRARIHGPTPRGAAETSRLDERQVILDLPRRQHPARLWILRPHPVSTQYSSIVSITALEITHCSSIAFANDLHVGSSKSAVTLAMLNAASVVGRLSMGFLSDKLNPWILALSSLFTTSVATFILWGVLSHSFSGLLAFGIAYGSIAGSWSSLWTGFVRPLAKDDPGISTTLFGYLLLLRGIGNIMSTPISAKLYSRPHNITGSAESTGFDVGNGRFETMIIYVGTCFAGAAGIAALGLTMDIRRGLRSSNQNSG